MRWQIKRDLREKSIPKRREEIVSYLLENRGITQKSQREEFLNPSHPLDLNLDSLLDKLQIEKALKRLKRAKAEKEKIIVYGDYDTDGICATAIVWEALASLGFDIMPFIPQRSQGYGLKKEKIKELSESKTGLIITVDQGIVAKDEIEYARKLGIDVILTDHHEPEKDLPKAFSIIHSTKLAGSGVAWFFAREILKFFKEKKSRDYLLDLAVIGTITDMVSLLGANRCIAKYGLEALKDTRRKGLRFLYQKAGIDKQNLKSWEVGFLIGPRINASGRMDDPMDALRLLCTIDAKRASVLADKIDSSNKQRQVLTEQTVAHAKSILEAQDKSNPLLFVYHESYEHGVIGLAASRLKDIFYKPSVVLAPREDYWVASARSIEGFNIIEAIRSCSDLLGDHGGHKLAAGFSVKTDKLEELRSSLIEIAKESLSEDDLTPSLSIDLELKFSDLSFDLVKTLTLFEPFGIDNPSPVFALAGLQIIESRAVGSDHSHLKLSLKDSFSGKVISGIFFKGVWFLEKNKRDEKVNVAFNLSINEFNGKRSLQLVIKDMKVNNNE